MGARQSVPDRVERVVVLGAGYAGSAVAQLASSRFPTTLIDRRDSTIHKIAGPRCAVSSAWSHLGAIPLFNFFGKNSDSLGHKVIWADVVKIDKEGKKLIFADGNSAEYDMLVLALGAQSTSPAEPPATCTTRAACESFFKGIVEEIKAAKHILIVGGGAAGYEITGELRHFHPDVQVTLCESSNKLVKEVDDSVSQQLLDMAKKSGVNVIFNDRVKSQVGPGEGLDTSNLLSTKVLKPANGVVRLASNRTIENVDLVFWCIGTKPSTALLTESSMGDVLDDIGRIKVNEYLQVEKESHIFAVGDCNNIPEAKLAMSARSNAKKGMFPPGNADGVFANLVATSCGQPLVPFKSQFNPPKRVVVAFGPKEGVAVNIFPLFSGMKRKGFFLRQRWQECNQPSPKVPAA